jgi:hypothetical protein
MDIQNLIENFECLCKDASDTEMQNIANMLSNLNIKKRNEDRIANFAKNIIEKQNKKKTTYISFLESASVNAIIWAPTQVGKSNASREFIETCFKYNVPVIVSTDNKSDQNEQLYTRVQNDLCGADVKMLKVMDKSFDDQFEKCLKAKNNRFVIFCLDNSAQIKKLTRSIKCFGFDKGFENIERFAILHDEADTVTKDKDVSVVRDDQAESHKKWIELVDIFNTKLGKIDLKRVFVTATPENCCMLYKIEGADLIKLEIPSTYRGYKDINYHVLEDDLDIKGVLEAEVRRIKADETKEVILYCIDRKIQEGQDIVLNSLASHLKCVINTYNGHGITAFMRTIAKSNKFESHLRHLDVSYIRDGKFFTIKDMTIRKFYTICKKIGEYCVVTIGKDLISRGISYVSEDANEPLTATTMIYKPGMTMHAVGITQTIGRITGCAMPNLQRRLYAPHEVIDTYCTYNKNQESYIKQIENHKQTERLTKDLIKEMVFEKMDRHIDRAKLNLKMNYENVHASNIHNVHINDVERMKQLIDMWWRANSIIGKILQYVYDHKKTGVAEDAMKTFLEMNSYSKAWYSDLEQQHKEYKLVFERSNGITKLKQQALQYINNK